MAWNEQAASDMGDPGFMGRLNNSAGAAAKAAEQMERLADRLLGASPPTPPANVNTSAKLREVPSGLFADVDSSADSISDSVERIFTAMRRIEDRLPIS